MILSHHCCHVNYVPAVSVYPEIARVHSLKTVTTERARLRSCSPATFQYDTDFTHLYRTRLTRLSNYHTIARLKEHGNTYISSMRERDQNKQNLKILHQQRPRRLKYFISCQILSSVHLQMPIK